MVEMVIAMLESKERELAAHRFPWSFIMASIFEATGMGCARLRENGGSLFWLFEGWGIG